MKSEEFTKKIFGGAILSIVIKAIGALLAYAVQVYLARILGVLNYGTFNTGMAIVGFVLVASVAGFDTSSLKYIARYRVKNQITARNNYINVSFCYCLAFSLLSATLIYLLHPLFNAYLGLSRGIVTAIALMIPLESLLQLFSSYFQGTGHVLLAQGPVALFRPLLILIGIFLTSHLSAAPNVIQAIAIITMTLLSMCIFYLFMMRRILVVPCIKRRFWIFRSSKVWLKSSLAFAAIGAFNIILNQLDILMIAGMVSNAATGLYAAAVKVSNLVIFVLTAVNVVISPIISELYAKRDFDRLAKILAVSARLTTLGATTVVVGLLFLSNDILGMFGEYFRSAHETLAILLIAQVINTAAGSVGFLMNMCGYQNYSIRALGLSATINIIANCVLIPKYGINGAAYATITSTVIWNLYLVIYAHKLVGIDTTCFSRGRYLK